MIVRARVVVTMDGAPIENGAVAIDNERIAGVGSFEEIQSSYSGEVIDLGERALLPGLINSHSHLDYTCLRGKIPFQESFADWIRSIIAAKQELSAADYLDSIRQGFREAKVYGTTSIANFTAFPELISQVEPSIRTWWFAELIDVRAASAPETIVKTAVDVLASTRHRGLAPHAPFTASPGLYRYCEEIARRDGLLLSTHLAESRDEQEMFSASKGSLFEFLSGLGRDQSDLHGTTPVEQVAAVCELDDRWLLVHLNEASMDDMEVLLRTETQPSIVHCPRSHAYFGHSPFKFGKFRTLGFNICLGTDSLASNDSLSLFAEMRAFRKRKPKLAPREILKMVTSNAARALHRSDNLGQIRPGLLADLIAVPCRSVATVFDEIIGFDQPVPWLMIGGKVAASS